MALMALGWLWWRAWARLVAGDAAALCVAGVALGDIHLRFTWQAWHLETYTFCVAGVALMALGWLWWRLGRRDAAALCVAGVALGGFTWHTLWQAGLALVARLGALGRR